MNPKAAAYLNTLILMQLEQGLTEYLVYYLKSEDRQYITQHTWNKLANWIEGGCQRPRKRPPTGQSAEIRGRNREIKRKYQNKRKVGTNQQDAITDLREEYPLLDSDTLLNIIKRK